MNPNNEHLTIERVETEGGIHLFGERYDRVTGYRYTARNQVGVELSWRELGTRAWQVGDRLILTIAKDET